MGDGSSLSILIKARVPKSNKIIQAMRNVWFYHLNYDYFEAVVDEIVEKSMDLMCSVCKVNARSYSGLRRCLRFHRKPTVNYYLDHMLVRVDT